MVINIKAITATGRSIASLIMPPIIARSLILFVRLAYQSLVC